MSILENMVLNHTSARQREETPHAIKSTNNLTSSTKETGNRGTGTQGNKTLNLNGTAKSSKRKTRNRNGAAKTTISNALRRRAQAVIKDKSIDPQSRVLIRYALEINDPWLPELVRRADAGETIINRRGLFANVRSLRRRFKRRKD